MFHEQFLQVQILKAQKRESLCQSLGSACAKAAHRMFIKLTPGVGFGCFFKNSRNSIIQDFFVEAFSKVSGTIPYIRWVVI